MEDAPVLNWELQKRTVTLAHWDLTKGARVTGGKSMFLVGISIHILSNLRLPFQ